MRFQFTALYACKAVSDHVAVHRMLDCELQGDFSLPLFVLVKLFLIMWLGTMCLHTSFRAMFVTVPSVHTADSHHLVGYHIMLVYKLQGDLSGPLVVW